MPILFFILLLLLPPACFAQSAEEAREALKGTLSQIKESDERQKALEEKNVELERDLKTLQKEMVSLAKQEEQQQDELASLEEKLDILEEQKKVKTDALNARQQELSAMISAMIKLRQLPPEAVIAMPGKLDETLATARALGVVSRAIEEEAESLKAQLHELELLEVKIRQNREVITKKKTALDERRKELATKVDERSKLQATLGGKEKQEKEHAAKLMAKSQNLQELLDSVEKSETSSWEHEPVNAVKKHDKHPGSHKLRSFSDAHGDLRIPSSGKIVSRYGNSSAGSAFSKGIVIETHPESQVTAPYDAEVVFAGTFRDYGRMVILRHSEGYHTLLAGMSSINCSPGQFLLEGEPLGTMGRRASSDRLYIELRQDGKPVDPLPWFDR
jgi:septal ring factor EnvC (AmiA/AmiB activator)